ncbi:MAG: cysteine hydrolase [Fusobacteriaceae bacterium]|jgi:ureidoacrylate peracid hydrolase|nr:cysteine hydrolase [Fusobacteriaceae bacterium]
MAITLTDLIPKSKPFPPVSFQKDDTVLLLIDMQRLATGEHILHGAIEKGFDETEAREALKAYDEELNAAVRQAALLLDAFRRLGMTAIHVKIESRSNDARETSFAHRLSGFLVPKGSYWGQWIPETAPKEGEIVITKTCSGAVTGSDLDTVLRNLRTKNVLVTGFHLNQCVETTVRNLADLGYLTFVVSDAVSASTPKHYTNTMENILGVYARAITAAEAIKEIEK